MNCFDDIIRDFRKDSQFINDFEGIINYFSQENIPVSDQNQLWQRIEEYNQKICSILKNENKFFDKIIKDRVCVAEETQELIEKCDDVVLPIAKQKIVNLDVSFYIKQINNATNEEEIEQILPDKSIESYNEIINLILTNLLYEMFDTKKILHKERHEIDEKTKEYFESSIKAIENKFRLIQIYKNRINASVDNKIIVKKENDLVFLKTNYGNVCAISDLKDISSEYYESIYELIESIINGTFKSSKTFTNNNNFNGLSEVRGDRTRVIFDRVGINTYAVLAIFIKKTNSSASYRAFLQNRSELYDENRSKIVDAIDNNDQSFAEENNDIKLQVYNIIKPSSKTKVLGD